MEIGIYSFSNAQRGTDGNLASSAESVRNTLEAIQLADRVGLDFFGVGEHHRRDFPMSSPATVLAAAAATTERITLASAVVVLSTDDPVRVFQQFATVDAISRGRVEIVAGRGSFLQSFPLFGYNLQDYDELFAEKFELLLELNATEEITWKGKFRPALNKSLVFPRPHEDRHMQIWQATGGNPESTIRAGVMGVPVVYGIIGGTVSRFAPLAQLYRKAFEQGGKDQRSMKVAVAAPGYIRSDGQKAKDDFFRYWGKTLEGLADERGWSGFTRAQYDAISGDDGAIFAGSPEEIAGRIVEAARTMGLDRIYFQTDVGEMPHEDFLASIELLGTKVKPLVEQELG